MRLLSYAFLLVLLVSSPIVTGKSKHEVDIEDNEFAEFEESEDEIIDDVRGSRVTDDDAPAEFEEEEVVDEQDQKKSAAVDDEEEDAVVEEFDEEFSEDEFIIDTDEADKPSGKEELKITKIPERHLRPRWDSFTMELLLLAGLFVYLLNLLAGRSKNQRIAQAWFNSHKQLLQTQFSLVGDDGTSKEPESMTNELCKESESNYRLWCSGRVCVEGMLVELRLLKRQDLVSVIAGYMKPKTDQLVVSVQLQPGVVDSYCLCVGVRRSVSAVIKEMEDLSNFCTEKKTATKYDLPDTFVVATEVGEAAAALLDRSMASWIRKHEKSVDYIHISDQFSGPRPTEDTQTTQSPVVKPTATFSFNLSSHGQTSISDAESTELMRFVFHCIDRLRRIRLSAKGKQKTEANRRTVAERYQKAAHVLRQEAAQKAKEEKRLREKQKIMDEKDPDRQRKLEAAQEKRDAKKQKPKMKMMKVKGM